MKVYVVGVGEYSDWSVAGIFSTIEDAMEAAKLCGHDLVEEYELDKFECNHRGVYPFLVQMTIDGVVISVSLSLLYDVNESKLIIGFGYNKIVGSGKVATMSATVFARDEAHAIKITNEKRAKIIATNQWGKNWLQI